MTTDGRTTTDLKQTILEKAGGKKGLKDYLAKQAEENPSAFSELLARLSPPLHTTPERKKQTEG